MDEKRIFPRKSMHVPVIIDDKEKVEMKNISIGGLCLITRQPILKGSDVFMKFSLPSNEEIRSQGQITWSKKRSDNKCECGIEFMNLKVNDFEIIRRYLTRENH